jgi:hypothetical protein
MAENGRRKRDDALALALASGQTLRAAAAAAGIAERTAARRWADPAFRDRVTELRAEMVSRASGKMGDAMAEAADVLRKLLRAKKESTRLAACRAILEFGVRLHETAENDAKIQALEESAREAAENEEEARKK